VTSSTGRVKADLREMYNRLADGYSTAFDSAAGRYFMRRKIEAMLDLGRFTRGGHLVEIGCADGAFTLEIGRLGFRITGLDLSPECIRVAAQRVRQAGLTELNFAVADAENLTNICDDTFDGAFSFSALRYVSDAAASIRELFRVVRCGAAVVVDFPNSWSPWFTFLKPLLTGETHIHDHRYTTGQVVAMMQAAGFRDVTARRILFTPKTTPGWILPALKAADYIGERTPGLNQLAAIIMVGGRK